MLKAKGKVSGVSSLTVCGDAVISGHKAGSLRVRNEATGRCDHVLQGHTNEVRCLACWEDYIVSGSEDHTIKTWQVGRAGSWPCLGTIAAQTDNVWSLVVWNGRVISGSEDETIMVHSIASRQHEATLDASTGAVYALAVSGEKLFSTSDDRAICEWALGTWECQRTIRVDEHVPDVWFPRCLSMSGSLLVCGGYCNDRQTGFVVVLDAQAMRCEHTLRLDGPVFSLLSLRGEVWGVLTWKDGRGYKSEQGAGASEEGGQ